MTRRGVFQLILMVIIIVDLISGNGLSQKTGDFNDLSISINVTRRDFLPCEPVTFSITMANKTSRPIQAHTMINPAYGFVEFYFAKDTEFEKANASGRWPSMTAMLGKDVLLEPGFRRSAKSDLFYSHGKNLGEEPGKYVLSAPGTYRIKSIFKSQRGEKKVESNIVTVNVKEPTGVNLAAYEFIERVRVDKELYYGDFLLTYFIKNITTKGQKEVDKKEEFLSLFSKSQYARYMEYSLGISYITQQDDILFRRGVKLLKKATGYRNFFLAEDVSEWLIRETRDRGEVDKAKEYQAEIAEKLPDSPLARD